MSLTVGILAYNSEQALPGLLASLPDALAGVDDWHLVVVDGASTDGTVDLVRRTAPEATCVDLGGNRGFAAAANATIAAFPATGAVLILSPRVRLAPGCVKVMLDALHEPGAGVAVPRLFRGPGQPYPSLRRRPTLLRAWAEALLGGRLTRPFGVLSELIADPAGYSSGTRADWATGAVTMMSRECVTRAGPWDESFFLYSEETEFELRAADAGFRLAFANVDVIHLGGESRVRPELWSLLCANRVRLYGMRHRRPSATLFWAAMLLGESLRSARAPIHRAAVSKLIRERAAIVARGPRAAHDGGPGDPSAVGGFTDTDISFVNNVFSTHASGCIGQFGVWFERPWPPYDGGPTDGWRRSGNRVLETGESVDNGNPGDSCG